MFDATKCKIVQGQVQVDFLNPGAQVVYDDLSTGKGVDFGPFSFRDGVVRDILADLKSFKVNRANALKGWLIRGRSNFGEVRFTNCGASNVLRSDDVHTDGFWMAFSKSFVGAVTFDSCYAANIQGVPFLWENGSCGVLRFVSCYTDWKYEIKLMPGCRIETLEFNGCIGNVSIYKGGGSIGKIVATDHRGNLPLDFDVEVRTTPKGVMREARRLAAYEQFHAGIAKQCVQLNDTLNQLDVTPEYIGDPPLQLPAARQN